MNPTLKRIETILKSHYETKSYVELVREIFPKVAMIAPDNFKKEFTNFSSHIEGAIHVGNYKTPDNKNIIIMAVQLKKAGYVENSRSTQRSYAKKLIENANADAAFIAFYTDGDPKWRLSFVRLDYEMKIENGRLKTEENLTPAKRYSYLVGENEPCHTAISRFERFIIDTQTDPTHPTLDDLENAFSVEKVTDEFFKLYCEKFHQLREKLEENEDFCIEAKQHNFTSAQFAKKLMGQIVFLYFLQKKGWLGVGAWPNALTEKEYQNAYYARGAKSRELIPIVYRPVGDGTYRISSQGLNSIKDEDEAVLAMCVKGKPWGSGPHNFMRKLYEIAERNHQNFYDDLLEPLFYEALNVNRGEQGYCPALHCRIPFLSGGLFEPIDGYEWKHNNFNIPNDVFSNIDVKGRDADGILDIFDRYNFTMSEDEPMEREVAIDPEMLGKVFENLLEVNDRKSKGAFYTPREIVHYMCQESLINYLTNTLQIEEEAIREFILYGDFLKDEDTIKEKRQGNGGMYISEKLYKLDTEGNIVVDRLKDIDEALKNVRVADPAVGSGAFPLGMLNEIVRARQNISAYMAITMNPYDIRMMYQMDRSPHNLKYETIKNCIFAADIDPSAVDIAQLRLWLALVIDDEINPNAQTILDGHKNPLPLPNLECNIVCGNTLVNEFEGINLIPQSSILGTEVEGEAYSWNQKTLEVLIPKLIEDQDKLFRCDDPLKKEQLKLEIDAIKDQMILAYLETMTAETHQKYVESKKMSSKPFVLWQIEFARIFKEKGGFDIVIGNPPYVKIQNIENSQAELLKRIYRTATGKFDLYVLFVEKAFELLNKSGMCSYIQPHRFLNVGYGKGLREYLKEYQGLKKVINFGVNQVFDTATTYTGIFFYTVYSKNIQYAEAETKDFSKLVFYIKEWSELGSTWSFSSQQQNSVLSKINSQNIKLLDVFEGIYQGLITLGDDKFIMSGCIKGDLFYGYSNEIAQEVVLEADIMKPVLKGENIRRYKQPTNTLYIIYPHIINSKGKTEPISEDIMKEKYPRAYKYLLNFQEELIEKKIKYKTNPKFWYSLHRAREKRIFESDKIITPQLQNYCNFAYDNQAMYPDAGGYMLMIKEQYKKDIFYYYGILNSSLFYHFIKNTSTAFNNNYYYFKTAYIEPFAFPTVTSEEIKNRIIVLVSKILEVRRDGNEGIAMYEKEIDELVYDLYELTGEERAQIEVKYNVV